MKDLKKTTSNFFIKLIIACCIINTTLISCDQHEHQMDDAIKHQNLIHAKYTTLKQIKNENRSIEKQIIEFQNTNQKNNRNINDRVVDTQNIISFKKGNKTTYTMQFVDLNNDDQNTLYNYVLTQSDNGDYKQFIIQYFRENKNQEFSTKNASITPINDPDFPTNSRQGNECYAFTTSDIDSGNCIYLTCRGGQNHAYGEDRKSTRLNSSHSQQSRMPSSA